MNITVNAISDFVTTDGVIRPFHIKVVSPPRIIRNESYVRADVYDTHITITAVIKFETIEEARSIKEHCLLKVYEGFILLNNDPNKNNVLSIQKFQVINNNTIERSLLPQQTNIPFSQLKQDDTKFILKGVVVSKSERIEYPGGYLFTFTLQDIDGSELKCICLQDNCDKYIDCIKENGTYHIFNGSLQLIDLECVITTSSAIKQSSQPIQRKSNVKPIKYLEKMNVSKLYSLCCVIHSVGKIEMENNKAVRVVKVVDQSNCMIDIKFYGGLTQIPDELSVKEIVQFDNLQLCFDNYRYMTYNEGLSKCIKLPNSNETTTLIKALEDNAYELKKCKRVRIRKNANGKPFKAIVTGYITAFKTDSISCIECNNCKKEINHNATICPHCNKQCNPQHRYNLKVEIQDRTNKIWATMFGEVATKYMGKSVRDLLALKESDFDDYINTFRGKTFIKVKLVLEGKLDEKMVLHTRISCYQILVESN
ncbi:Replication factor A protein 1 [Entamoeba marina]